MLRHILVIVIATLVIAACMLLPFLPGAYDALAVPLSMMAQIFAIVGLVLVPVGAIWLGHEIRLATRPAPSPPARERTVNAFAVVGLVLATLAALAVALGGVATAGFSLGILALLSWAGFVAWAGRRHRARRAAPARAFHPAPLYLLILPLAAAALRFAAVDRASDFARDRAIRNSAPLVADIERYRDARGHYPPSLVSIHTDYRPGVIGVPRFHYERAGDAYNLYFEHFTSSLDARAVVMFNKLGQHQMTSHDMDLLQFTGAELDRRRGYFVSYATPTPHWRCFLFD